MELDEDFPFKIYGKPELRSSAMVIGWSEDAGKLGQKATDYLIKNVRCVEIGEVKSIDFFPSLGVSKEDDVARFPESKFYCCQQKDLVIFKSSPPKFGWYQFIDAVLDVAEHYHTKELYTVSGLVTSCAHSAPRELLVTVNSPELKIILSKYDLATDVVYKTSPGQKPTLNSFLLWLAKRRNIAGANLCVTVPYYLASTNDFQSCKKPTEFLDMRLNLGIDFRDLDGEISKQDEKIAQLRMHFPEIDSCIRKLESKLGLTPDENEKLVREIRESLKKAD